MVTAALDLVRHANVRLPEPLFLRSFLVMPQDHHRHHDAERPFANYGANLILWDKLFGTFDTRAELPNSYAVADPPPFTTQLLYPWRS
jgi:sterol desaturase/sphingolipid hydroxylase (fatty acid hydroxylase superfamily)